MLNVLTDYLETKNSPETALFVLAGAPGRLPNLL